MLRNISVLLGLVVLTSLPAPALAQKKRAKMPTWKEMRKVAVDTLFADIPETMARDMVNSQKAEELAAIDPNDP